MISTNNLREPIDKICFFLIAIFSFIIVLLISSTKFCYEGKCLFNNNPEVKEFSWQDKKIGSIDKAFYLVFDRPMSHESVEANLRIEPSLEGKISWSGKRLVYTLERVIPYGRNYRLSLQKAQEKFRGKEELGAEIEPFIAEFQSRDRAFAYIGSQGEESGRLILNNSTKQNKTILTPENLTVVDFKFTKNSEKIIFSAVNEDNDNADFKQVDIYEVTTGLSNDLTPKIPGELKLILNGKEYQNNQFDLAGENQEIIIVQRIKHNDPLDFALWKIAPNKVPEKLNTEGGDFTITPDGKGIAIAQGEGIAILPIESENQEKIINFLPKYGQVLTFSNDGSSAAMINFNKDNSELRYTRSLFYVNNQGVEKELINIKGSIIDCKFNGNGNQLFCLLTELMQTETELIEKPYFVAIDIQSGKIVPLVALPKYQDIKISMAPDGLGILFDQLITENDLPKKALKNLPTNEDLLTNSAELIVGSRLWLLTLPTSESPQAKLEELPISGFKPQWSP
ncbi:hypothetical protein WEU38_16870 [Cyanobacterium aponinum AL20118]|uniref:SbsA Ig-like domain-containing protein n=1 Tax=Cyanobacterium aponinum AL20115 TaxID=3090662 RepID=A0AAF0ZAP3_9CHRO|nr:hypothetical protein [Cyanobacterium aponinum]PHV61658.1 hypothetical protein CSQ80_14520 [Cyanobacterium aponinum IPPAS B-1201]WPF88458.1 hypothetical protein SAY89_16950 [Cyanobacterium aponinum AL20115]